MGSAKARAHAAVRAWRPRVPVSVSQDRRGGGRALVAGWGQSWRTGYRRVVAGAQRSIREAAEAGSTSTGQVAGTERALEAGCRRADLRLVFPTGCAWVAAVAGLWLSPVTLAVLGSLLLIVAGLLLSRSRRHGRRFGRSFRATCAISCVLAAVVLAHSAVAASQRSDGPLAAAIQGGKGVAAVVEIASPPRALTLPGLAGTAERWAVPVWTQEVSTGGVLLRTRAQLVVIGSGAWGAAVPGQVVRATGKLRPPDLGRQEAGSLAASSPPTQYSSGAVLEVAAKYLRGQYLASCSFLGPDVGGLLPGMVTGDTSALDESLALAMKNVGMTHLTAVSGANCSLVLGALLLLCRRLRLRRVAAGGVALCGLGLFVVLVGPDASVLRAALMGAVSVAALATGRAGRGLSFLCVAVMGLLLIDPALGASFGFLLSVLATLGIIVVGREIIDWAPAQIPLWLRAGVAVPLSAQLLCGPIIVLLQAQFSTYSLLANVLAAPLVAPVTLVGTLAVPLSALAPWVAGPLIAVAGAFCAGVAWVARFAAELPGASLPWAEGIPGLVSMVLLSALTLGFVWMVSHPGRTLRWLFRCHRRIEVALESWERSRDGQRGRPRGLAEWPRHGRLEDSTSHSERTPPWPLRRNAQPVPRRRTRPTGGMPARRRSSW